MPTIRGSVGRDGVNDASDVRVVQHLLNGAMPLGAGPLRVDGIAGPKTEAAIVATQSRLHLKADGRIDPRGPSLRKLVDLQFATIMRGIDPQVRAALLSVPKAGDTKLEAVAEQLWRSLGRAS